MPRYKFAVTLSVLLLLALVLHVSVSAQSDERKWEVGVQASGIGAGRFQVGDAVGGGGRVTYNLNKYVALESELNYFTSVTTSTDLKTFQGQFGVKAGQRFKKFGIFGKARPGFINTREDFIVFNQCPPGVLCIQQPFSVSDSNTGFSLDVGGVAELYPSKRILLRVDVGDTIANRRAPAFIFYNSPVFGIPTGSVFLPPVIVSGSSVTTHNLQLSVGVGFRF